ncbi:hypothetical protein ASC90_23380 [Rhizobium sp. Root1220]|nr:hypothetical protein ASC90_23380 [Rhizobium sp. Root1220]
MKFELNRGEGFAFPFIELTTMPHLSESIARHLPVATSESEKLGFSTPNKKTGKGQRASYPTPPPL